MSDHHHNNGPSNHRNALFYANVVLFVLLIFTLFHQSLRISQTDFASSLFAVSKKQLCREMEHIPGQWMTVQSEAEIHSGWPCCGQDINDDEDRCRNSYYLDANGYQHGDDSRYAIFGGHGCHCGSNIKPAKWIAENCDLLHWDKIRFCQALAGRRILFIGDSTMQQTAAVIMNAVHGSCARSITFAQSDTLVGEYFGAMNRGKKWDKIVNETDANIVVLTVGAHINSTQNFLEIIDRVRSGIEKFPDKKFIWKTQNPGGCSSSMQEGFDAVSGNAPSRHADYRWGDFYHRDLLAIDFFRGTKVSIFDTRPLYLRTEAHPGSAMNETGSSDCLHFCGKPVVMNLLPILLHHLLV